MGFEKLSLIKSRNCHGFGTFFCQNSNPISFWKTYIFIKYPLTQPQRGGHIYNNEMPPLLGGASAPTTFIRYVPALSYFSLWALWHNVVGALHLQEGHLLFINVAAPLGLGCRWQYMFSKIKTIYDSPVFWEVYVF